MKKIVIYFFVLLFLVGCGDKKAAPKYQGISENTDYTKIAIADLAKKDIPNAIKNFDNAIKADPTNTQKFITLGQVYLGLKNYDRAIDTFTAAIKVGPNNPEAFYFFAMSKSLAGRKEDEESAIIAAKRSVELYYEKKDQEGMVKAMALYKSLTGKTDQHQVAKTQ